MINEGLRPLPTDAATLEQCLSNPFWRITSGCLYAIKVKGDSEVNQTGGDAKKGSGGLLHSPTENSDVPIFEVEDYQSTMIDDLTDEDLIRLEESFAQDDKQSFIQPFIPNEAQMRFIKNMWYRNIILKARQLGLTTLVCIIWLDHALFNANQNCGIIAQDKDTVFEIFRDKIRLAYDNLPDEIRERFWLKTSNASEMVFGHNGSKIRVATSFRGGTIHRLHISEFGKICAMFPIKANEVITGSLPAVPTNGIAIIESTAEGQSGHFYSMVQRAMANFASRKKLSMKDYRFHFYAWWQEPKYRVDATSVIITARDHENLDRVESEVKEKMQLDIKLDPEQRAWYIATRDNDLNGDRAKMWQEYPSHPDEAFQVATDGNYYAEDMFKLRSRNGITQVEVLDVGVNTFWDIGNSDGCAIWFHQMMNQQDRFIGYYEEHGKDLRHYAAELQRLGFIYHTHFLPHDAAHQRLGDFNKSVKQQLQEILPNHTFVIVPRITQLITGIQHVRKNLKNAWFDKDKCELGIKRLDGYTKKFSQTEKRYLDIPDKSNGCTEGADALRQWAQAKELGMLGNYVYTQNRDSGDNTDTHGYVPAPPTDWRF